MGECEFKEPCESAAGFKCHIPIPKEKCMHYEYFQSLLNSPQFKKQYAKLSVVKKVLESLPVKNDDFVRDVMDEIEVVGRTE